ncbi:MAG: hypothetical protein KKH75_02620, partial [Actinobacteria bacterium]|nr:hypothetical protein [Actinomycetota bacterium]
ALVRIVAPAHLKEIDDLFTLAMSDETSSWWLDSVGGWTRHSVAADGKPLVDIQEKTMSTVQRRRRSRAAR